MASPKQERILIKKQIIAVLNRDKQARIDELCAQIGLEYGMKNTSIKQIIDMLVTAGLIVIDGNLIKVAEIVESAEVPEGVEQDDSQDQ